MSKRSVEQLTRLYEPMGLQAPSFCQPSLEDVTFDIKRKANHNIELFDEAIQKMVDDYRDFEVVYREEHALRFIDDVKGLNSVLNENPRAFQEKLRVFDDNTKVERQRMPVARAYLSIFNTNVPSDKTIAEDDFWKAFDFKDLGCRIHTATNFGGIQKLLLDNKAHTWLEKIVGLLGSMNTAVIDLSKDYESVLARMIATYQNRETISKAETIDLTKYHCNICGVLIKPLIPYVINRRWYGNNLRTELGNSLADTKILLSEPYNYITPNDAETVNGLTNLITLANSEQVYELLIQIQRNASRLVDQIELSSKRLTRVADHIRGWNASDSDGAYNDGIMDMTILIALYGGTLVEVLKFVTQTAYNFNKSYLEVHSLYVKVQNLYTEVERYIQMRKRDVGTR